MSTILLDTFEFRVKQLPLPWQDNPIAFVRHDIALVGAYNIAYQLSALSGNQEVRFNYKGSLQGHYVTKGQGYELSYCDIADKEY
jgi:hypothetical protein